MNYKNTKTIDKMTVSTYKAIITLTVTGVSVLKTEWRYKNNTHIYAIYKKLTLDLKTYRLKVRGWRNVFHVICASDSFSTVVVLWGLWLLETMQTNLTLIVLEYVYMLCCLQHLCSNMNAFWLQKFCSVWIHIFKKVTYFISSSKTPTFTYHSEMLV